MQRAVPVLRLFCKPLYKFPWDGTPQSRRSFPFCKAWILTKELRIWFVCCFMVRCEPFERFRVLVLNSFIQESFAQNVYFFLLLNNYTKTIYCAPRVLQLIGCRGTSIIHQIELPLQEATPANSTCKSTWRTYNESCNVKHMKCNQISARCR